MNALLDDLQRSESLSQGRALSSIFLGGGTPSLFSASAIERVLLGAEALLGFDSDIEITMEANPGTFEQEKFTGFRQAGVNRLSIGIQSFNDAQLQALGRIHSSSEAVKALAMARKAGFTNINLDLMHGLPGQTPDGARLDLQQALDLQPEHLSWYQLTIEPNTEFYNRPPALPVEDALVDIQQLGEDLLAEQGFVQYEVSAYQKQGRYSRHNLNYWSFGDYLGIGAGAHGKVTLPELQSVVRTRKTRLPQHYLDSSKDYTAAEITVDQGDLVLEFMMNALRLNQGVDRALFTQRTGLKWDVVASEYQSLQDRGLTVADESRIAVTEVGHRYLNEVLSTFMDIG